MKLTIWSGMFRSEEHTCELQSLRHLVCRLLLEKKKKYPPPRFSPPPAILRFRSTPPRSPPPVCATGAHAALNWGLITSSLCLSFFFFNDPAPPEISPLPLHDPLPISMDALPVVFRLIDPPLHEFLREFADVDIDRKSTRLNSSHLGISYAVFCL